VKPLLAATATEAPDEQLVAAARDGSDEAFEVLFRRYRDRVVGYVRGMVADHGRAEDIVQEAFMSALRALRRSDQEIVFRPWIYQIAKNACIDHLRRARGAQEVSIDSDDFSPVEENRISQVASGTDAAVARRNQLESLRMAFYDLPPTQHEILVMRELEGLSYDSIGNRMGLTRGAVESMLFRARRRLRDGFDEIDTGARCESMGTAMEGIADGSARARDRRHLSNHLQQCKPCRRRAVAMGLDSLVLGLDHSRARRAVKRAAACLPLPAFLRRRLDEAAGGFGPAAQAGVEHGASLADKATAILVATVVAAGGAGVAHKATGGSLLGGGLPLVGDSKPVGDTGRDSGDDHGSAVGGDSGAPGTFGSGPGVAGGVGPAGPYGPAAAGQGALPGALGGPLGAAGPGADGGLATGDAGRLVQTLPGAPDVGQTVDSVGGVVGVSPDKKADKLAKGNAGGGNKDNGGQAVDDPAGTVKHAPKVKEVTKTVPKGNLKAPKEVKLPADGSVKTGKPGKTEPSVTLPETGLPVPPLPPVQLPTAPATGLGL